MKIENIALGDSVQVKKSMCHSEFKAKQVCEVIDIDLTDKHGLDVLIQGKNCLDWVNHKDLKKYIERDTAAELLEVDLSSELTGSDLARALKNRDEWVLVYVSDENDATAEFHQRPAIVTGATDDGRFKCGDTTWRYAVPINNQGEPLTAAEAGF